MQIFIRIFTKNRTQNVVNSHIKSKCSRVRNCMQTFLVLTVLIAFTPFVFCCILTQCVNWRKFTWSFSENIPKLIIYGLSSPISLTYIFILEKSSNQSIKKSWQTHKTKQNSSSINKSDSYSLFKQNKTTVK